MLSTGVFDDLAHIIKEHHKLEIQARRNIGLRYTRAPKCYEELKDKNTSLYDSLLSESVQRQIGAFYPIRDSLQHRVFFQVVQFSDSRNSIHNKSVIELSEEASKLLIEEPTASNCIYSLGHFMDPLLFITWAQGVLINIVDTVLSLIDWDSLYESLSQELKDRIRQSDVQYEKGVGHLFGWPQEPWYF